MVLDENINTLEKAKFTEVSGETAVRVAVVEGGSGSTAIYTTRLDDVGSGVTYVGLATPGSATSGALWQIKKITETGPDIEVLFADGNANFDNVWNNRLSLTYS